MVWGAIPAKIISFSLLGTVLMLIQIAFIIIISQVSIVTITHDFGYFWAMILMFRHQIISLGTDSFNRALFFVLWHLL